MRMHSALELCSLSERLLLCAFVDLLKIVHAIFFSATFLTSDLDIRDSSSKDGEMLRFVMSRNQIYRDFNLYRKKHTYKTKHVILVYNTLYK